MDESPSRLPMPSQLPSGNKRRSLLLPPGAISGVARKTSAITPTDEDMPVALGKQRPMTMFGLPRPLQSTTEETESTKRNDEDSRSPSPESREVSRASAHAALIGNGPTTRSQTATCTAPKSGIARSSSVRAPGTSRIGLGLKPPTARSGTGRPISIIKESTSRPQSVASTGSSGKEASAATSTRLRAPAPPSTTNTGLRRSNTTTAGHSRTQSALTSSTTTASAHVSRRHPTISEGTTKHPLKRPDFNTNQQHYSPKKNLAPKPVSSTLIHSTPLETSGSTSSLETQLLQARLLQLTILHRQAIPTLDAWQNSAKKTLKHKFTDIAAECTIVAQKEKELRRKANTAALLKWCKNDLTLLAEQVSVLSNAMTEVMALVEDGGRVHQALEIFEAWVTWVEAIYRNRENSAQSRRGNVEFVEGLGEGWKQEIAALGRKLSALGRELDGLGKMEDAEESSLRELVEGMRGLVRGCVEELRAVEGLEREFVRREVRWVDEQVGSMSVEVAALLAA